MAQGSSCFMWLFHSTADMTAMHKSIHILLLEDDPVDAELLIRLLNKKMHSTVIRLAIDKSEFLAHLDTLIPDIIIADNSVPGFNAADALLLLTSRSLRIPFILVTGTVSEEFAAGIIKMGASDYILKDRPTRLPAAIISAIRHFKTENEKLESYSRLIHSEEKYRNVLERITDAFLALDKNWCYLYANAQIGVMTGRDPKSLIGKNIWDEFPGAVGSLTYKNFHKAMEEQIYITHIDYFEPLKLWQENHIYPSPDGVAVFIRDISARKRSENEILKKNTELRELSSYLQDVREQERIRIAHEIHDELGQQLTGLKMDLLYLQKQMLDKNDDIRFKISDAVSLIDDTVKSVIRIAAELRPSILDDLGLIPALHWFSRESSNLSGIRVEFSSSLLDLHIPIEIATGIFRIYQESLANAIRHTKATKIVSSLEIADGLLKLVVTDNGLVPDNAQSSSGKKLGLLGVKERIHIMGGQFDIISKPEEGTELLIKIPLNQLLC
jgi:two-component system, NarL family, sensor histidine kinase UhpB